MSALLVQLLGGRIARYHCTACTSGLGQSVWYPDQVLCLWRALTLPLRVCGVLRSIGMFALCVTRFASAGIMLLKVVPGDRMAVTDGPEANTCSRYIPKENSERLRPARTATYAPYRELF